MPILHVSVCVCVFVLRACIYVGEIILYDTHEDGEEQNKLPEAEERRHHQGGGAGRTSVTLLRGEGHTVEHYC